MTYLFSSAGRAALHAFVNHSTLYAFDLDGTLAPIVADPARIMVPHEVRSGLIRLSGMAPVAIITGRARSDAQAHLGFNPRILVGNHGAEGLPGFNELEVGFVRMSSAWESQLRLLLPDARNAGIVVENKGATLALHYRGAPDRDLAQRAILAAMHRLEPLPRRVSGKYVENLVPPEAPHKGDALSLAMHHLECRRALFVGDDETDEDAFRLGDETIFGIRVGVNPLSCARTFIRDQHEIGTLLAEIVSALESSPGKDAP